MTKIFLIDEQRGLVGLEQTPFASEDLLQQLLARHPEVLGDAGGSEAALLLISREFGVPDDDGASDRWSLDHLFVDRNAIPVLVEVKRASDSRIRREVVAQMLDYAANGVSYWPASELIAAFERTCAADGAHTADQLRRFAGDEHDPEAFWKQVETNLRSGMLRMVFVADSIPKELRRIVEFLNEQMRPAEVLAIEVQQYLGDNNVRTLVPRLVGNTERAQSVKAVRPEKPPISLIEWLDSLERLRGAETRRGADLLIAWAQARGCEVGVTKSQDAVYVGLNTEEGKKAWPLFIRSTGKLELALIYLKYRPRFAHEGVRKAVIARFDAIPGINVWTKNPNGWPAFDIALLTDEERFQAFSGLADDVLSEAAAV